MPLATALLESALRVGAEVRIRHAGLSTPELRIARVLRVVRGGPDIPAKFAPSKRPRYSAMGTAHTSGSNGVRLY